MKITNIGMHKILIQQVNNDQKLFLYDLSPNEKFAGFVEFNTLSDLGCVLDTDINTIECCSRIVFMTEENNRLYINLMLMDPFYHKIEIAKLKSLMYFKPYIGL